MQVIDAQDLDRRRCNEDLAEGLHPVGRLLARSNPALTELIDLIQGAQLDLELQRRTTMTAGQRHQQPGREPGLPSGLHLASDEVKRVLAV